MKKKHIFFALVSIFVSALISLSSCGKNNGNDPLPPEPEKPKPQIPAWDKSKTATIYFISKLDDNALTSNESDYRKLGDYLSKKTFHAAFINRSDVHINNRFNAGAICAFAATKACAFALQAYNGNVAQGTSILVDSIVSQTEMNLSDKLSIKNIPAKINQSLDMPLSHLHIADATQIAALSQALDNIYTNKQLIIGTINASLYTTLESTIKNSGKKFRLEKVKTETSTPNNLFILSPHYWLLRETTLEKVGENIPVYCLQIETNVFY